MKVIDIRSLEALQELTGRELEEEQRAPMQQLLERFPVRVTEHLLSLMKTSDAVARQFLPDIREVTTLEGQTHCFSGVLHTELAHVERVYLDRCIIMPQPACPAYCRFCFRKFYEHASGRAMSDAQITAALDYVADQRDLHEVLITGGEPVLDRGRLLRLLRGLREIAHIDTIRIACRSLITAPDLIDDALIALLAEFQDLRAGKPIEVALHCNHPEELSMLSIGRIAALREAGLHVYNQAVLLRGLNLDAAVMLELLRRLRRHGVESYHLFFGGPVQGVDYWRPSIDEALALKTAIRQRATGRLNPHLIVTTRLGKVEIGVDGWIVEREADSRHVWIRTPYRLEVFEKIDPRFSLQDDARLDDEGFIVVRYLDGPCR
jgi:lysine 2,3-aminomutase